MQNWRLLVILSLLAGYVDTAGFLALHGLFTAHVTGNFVTMGAALTHGSSGALAKLLALPVFCLIVALMRLFDRALSPRGRWGLRHQLVLQLALLCLGCALAIWFGPFPEGDAWPAVVTGMVLVAAMAIQNAVQRLYLSAGPPTTLMTGSTTQIVIDLVDMARGLAPEARQAAGARFRKMAASVLSFAVGCAAGALGYHWFGERCFIGAPVLSLLALGAALAARNGEARQP